MSNKPIRIKPIKDRLLVKKLSREEVRESGIIIPENVQSPFDDAEIVETSDNSIGENFSKGDKIRLIGVLKNIGVPIDADGQKFFLIKVDHVSAIYESENKS